MDEIQILPSLQRPKRVVYLSSDGVRRSLLCKPRDDLRKDLRLLEIASLANIELPARFKIQIYAAIPLREDTGIIEWVDSTISLRSILTTLYKSKGITINFPGFKELQKSSNFSSIFQSQVLSQYYRDVSIYHFSRYPPQFYRWFYRCFHHSAAWHTSRLEYTRSSAVMCMFGHVLGLGDRHCENILFLERDGRILHVDFSCLFEKVGVFVAIISNQSSGQTA